VFTGLLPLLLVTINLQTRRSLRRLNHLHDVDRSAAAAPAVRIRSVELATDGTARIAE